MKQTFKKVLAFLLAAVLMVSAFSVTSNAYTAEDMAEGVLYVDKERNTAGKLVSVTKKRISVGSFDEDYDITADLVGKATFSVKSNKPGALLAKVTYTETEEVYNKTLNKDVLCSRADIGLYAVKAGTYKVTITATDEAGKTYSKTVTVLASLLDRPIKSIKLGKKTIVGTTAKVKKGQLDYTSSYLSYSTAKSGKLKVTPNTKYKITGIVYKSVSKKGKVTMKKVKNGGKIVLSQGYAGEYSNALEESSSRSDYKKTYVYVSYKDTFTGDSVTYSVSKSRGRKEVKCVYYEKATGRKSVDFYADTTVTLWNF